MNGQTDSHGHFVIEPLSEGEYFAQFEGKGIEYTVSFAVMQDYARCGAGFVELNSRLRINTLCKRSWLLTSTKKTAQRTTRLAIESRRETDNCCDRAPFNK